MLLSAATASPRVHQSNRNRNHLEYVLWMDCVANLSERCLRTTKLAANGCITIMAIARAQHHQYAAVQLPNFHVCFWYGQHFRIWAIRLGMRAVCKMLAALLAAWSCSVSNAHCHNHQVDEVTQILRFGNWNDIDGKCVESNVHRPCKTLLIDRLNHFCTGRHLRLGCI